MITVISGCTIYVDQGLTQQEHRTLCNNIGYTQNKINIYIYIFVHI